MVFRLWTIGKAVDWPTLRDGSPPGIKFSAKITNGDFVLDFPINPLLNGTAPSERRFMVLTDAFREYNGWSSSVCYMGPQWAPRLAIAAANGAKDMNGWGSWAPGCTWPDSGAQLLNWTQADGYKAWRGYWNSYRMFNGTATNGGFSMTQANAYALYRLSWNASDTSEAIATDWSTLYFGATNSIPVAGILAESINAWYQTSEPSSIGDYTLMWTMMTRASPLIFQSLYTQGVTADQCRQAMNASMESLAVMQGYLDMVDPSAIPGSPSQAAAAYAGLVRSIGISRDYLTAYFWWREAGIRNASLATDTSQGNCAVQMDVLRSLSSSVSTFAARYPLEDSNWAVSTLGTELYSVPFWWAEPGNVWYRTMAEWVPAWQAAQATACG